MDQTSWVPAPAGAGPRPGGRARTACDLLVVFLVVGAVVANSALAPSHTYSYAQLLQCGAAEGMIQSGNYFLPRNQLGNLARKPQLYSWCQVAVLRLTGAYTDFTYRLPTVVASFLTAALVYLIGRRWYGRRTALLAACLWAVCVHMAKEMYVGLTDMMVTMWITASVLCADRLLFHRAPRPQRRWYAVALWATMALGALTKGWGVLNLALVGLMLAIATAVGPGFAVLRAVEGRRGKLLLTLRVIGRRWRRAMKATHFLIGLVVLACVLVPVWYGMFRMGGAEFRGIAYFEIFQRITGSGEDPPHPSSVPAFLKLLYYALPGTVFAAAALVLAGARRWFTARSPVFLPLCWVIAMVLPFELTYGSRKDYLLPAFAAVALMGAWGVAELTRRGPGPGRLNSGLRHLFAAVPVVIGAGLILVPLLYLFHPNLPRFVQKNLELPVTAGMVTWHVLAAMIVPGAAVLAWAVRSSLRWRLWSVAGVAVVGMLGVLFLDRHFFSRHARTGDGDKMVAFAAAAGPVVGDDDFAVYRMDHLLIEVYLGRFGTPPEGTPPDAEMQRLWTPQTLRRSKLKWLFVSDHGLADWSRAASEQQGRPVRIGARDLGTVAVCRGPVLEEGWGRMYLVRLAKEPATTAAAAPGRQGE